MADGVADLAAGVAAETSRPAGLSAPAEAEDLGAPLYVAWQITNECNLACLHCIEESGPGKAFRDELDAAGVFAVIDELMDNDVPARPRGSGSRQLGAELGCPGMASPANPNHASVRAPVCCDLRQWPRRRRRRR